MGCNCGKAKNKVPMTSEALAAAAAQAPTYTVLFADGTSKTYDLYVDAARAQRLHGGQLIANNNP